MEEFDYEEYREWLQKAANSEEYQAMLQRTAEAMENISEAFTKVAEKLTEVLNNIDWDSIFKVLMEGQEEDVLEDHIRSGEGRCFRDSVRYRGSRRPAGRGRDWRRAELPVKKSYARRWKYRAARMRRDFRRRRK